MGFIPPEVIQQVLDRSDIVDIVSVYVPLKKSGRNFKALSPFKHEKTPSFFVNPDKQIFHCFSTGMGGNAISFIMKMERLEFPDAVRFLADKAGITIPEKDSSASASQLWTQIRQINLLTADYYHRNLISGTGSGARAARQYLEKRGIGPQTAKDFHLGCAPEAWDELIKYLRQQGMSLQLMEKAGLIVSKTKGDGYYDRYRNRIIFPIYDILGKCVAFGGRTLETDNPVKYINSPETPIYTKGKHLYGLYQAKQEISQKDFVIVVEGYIDLITPFQHGVHHIVASLGTALTVDQIRLIRRYTKNVVLLFDSDDAGLNAMVRSLDLLIEEEMNVKVALLEEGEDPDSFVRKAGAEAFLERVSQAQTLFDFKLQYLQKRMDARSIEGRVRISEQMLPTIQRSPNAIIRSEWIKRLAQALSVSEEALIMEVKKIASLPSGVSSAARLPNVIDQKVQIHPAEREIIRLMLDGRESIVLVKEQLELNDFCSDLGREIAEKIFELFEAGQAVNPAMLMNCFENGNIGSVITDIVSIETGLSQQNEKIIFDCARRLKSEQSRFERKKLRRQMEVARARGDEKHLQELLQHFNQLIKKG